MICAQSLLYSTRSLVSTESAFGANPAALRTGNPLTFRNDRRLIAMTASGQILILIAADMRAPTLTHSCRRRIRHLRGRAGCSCQPVESELADTDFPLKTGGSRADQQMES